MPFVRFSRDKRGYEYVYLVHTPTRRGRSGRSRVLYWYRTPPGVRVGRQPFDIEVQRAQEQQNPGVLFDWEAIVGTPMPPPDMTEFWRERRRAEKVARQERRAMEAEESATGELEAGADAAGADEPPEFEETAGREVAGERDEAPEREAPGAPKGSLPAAAPFEAGGVAPPADGQSKKRRRRRGGRRRIEPAAGGTATRTPGEGSTEAGSSGPAVNPSEVDDSAPEGE